VTREHIGSIELQGNAYDVAVVTNVKTGEHTVQLVAVFAGHEAARQVARAIVDKEIFT
jgi:hypothetical protein